MKIQTRVVIVQTHVPEFRVPVFNALHARLNGEFSVWSGAEYFSPTMGAPATARPWHRSLRNHFLLGRAALWQSGHLQTAVKADVCVLEFNPRIVSSWMIMIIRLMLRRETFLWGHLSPRAGIGAWTIVVRLLMLQLANKINLYTHAEAKELAKLDKSVRWNVSPNAVMWRKECTVPVTKGSPHRFLFVARLVEDKKPLLLLQAFARALPGLPENVHLDFIGDGPMKTALQAEIDRLGLGSRITLHGSTYEAEELRKYYSEAIVSLSPGYVGLSATQSFAFGVPMLIAAGEPHSVEIGLCEKGFNCEFFESDSVPALADALREYAYSMPEWAKKREEISAAVRNSYTYDDMVDGFMRLFAGPLSLRPVQQDPIHIVIAWIGLPYYAARVVQEAMNQHPEWRFTVISSVDGTPYQGIERMVGKVHWIKADEKTSWSELGLIAPDFFLITSWPHRAYQSLAWEAKRTHGTCVVPMVDNFLRYTPKQIAGFFYYRGVLRRLYSAVWVPGAYSRRFMRFLGVQEDLIYEGLYSADPDLFRPSEKWVVREGVVFVGQFVSRKGVLELAAAVQDPERGSESLVTFIGHGPLQGRLAAAGMRTKPFAQAQELSRYYRQASALILPSKIDHWGVVAHEAALSGCLLLVTRQCGCVAELVSHKLNGFVMERGSEREIRAALSWLHSLSDHQIALGREESIRRAKGISPQRWAATLAELVRRFVPRASGGKSTC